MRLGRDPPKEEMEFGEGNREPSSVQLQRMKMSLRYLCKYGQRLAEGELSVRCLNRSAFETGLSPLSSDFQEIKRTGGGGCAQGREMRRYS